MTYQVRRSELICPGHSMKMMEKAAASEADEVIFDLEDACALSQKAKARQEVASALAGLAFGGGKLRAFRVNAVDTPFCFRDVWEVLQMAGKHVDAIVLPKVNQAADIHFLSKLVEQVEADLGLVRGKIQIEAQIETALGLHNAYEIAKASPRVRSLIFGIADFAGDWGARNFKEDAQRLFYFPRAHMLNAARAAGVDAIDSVTVQFRDTALVEHDSKEAAQMGYDGKWAIHPSQLAPIHSAFTPSEAELERARSIVKAYRQADIESGTGAIVIGDEMVDAATLKVEEKKLAIWERICALANVSSGP
ncbi:MAG: CoA ester lyase [Proteobacteria bacterium]|nr:CoA ester lyase [Cystobacterineae bacterium]MCL2258827.1 CoA ester lyase [Cystobacterineae bacterium]MCL2314804.1 CoA ester lyase [Pseudomonadota bacterium]